jgi:hypothetical protein
MRAAWLIALILICSVAQAQPAGAPPPPPAPSPSLPPLPMVPPPLVVPPPPPLERSAEPLAGYTLNGGFFLRDPHDWFVLLPRGRLQVDWYNFPARGDLPAGAEVNSGKDPRPKNTLFVRRARVEMQGTFIRHFDFHIAGEWASAPPTGSTGTVADAYIIVDYLPYLKLQAGQFDIPFTMENRTSDKYFDFMERSLAVRAFGVPTNKDQGGFLFGWLPRRVAYYSVGLINGDGQNFKNQDNYPALVGRGFVAPLAWMPLAEQNGWLRDIWVGASFWYQKAANLGGPVGAALAGGAQNDLTPMTTQGGVSFFATAYANGKDAAGNAVRSHLAQYGDTVKWAVEANVPIKWVGARFELVHQSLDLAQYNDTNPVNATILRSAGQRGANLDGYAYYIELYAWILGDWSFIETPGLETAPRLRHFAAPREGLWGLMVAAKYEHVGFDVTGLPQAPGGSPDRAAGAYEVHAFELGVNAWGTRHVRLTCNYLFNYFDGDAALIEETSHEAHCLDCRDWIHARSRIGARRRPAHQRRGRHLSFSALFEMVQRIQ